MFVGKYIVIVVFLRGKKFICKVEWVKIFFMINKRLMGLLFNLIIGFILFFFEKFKYEISWKKLLIF